MKTPLVTLMLLTLTGLALANLPACQQGTNCKLPNCFCDTTRHPSMAVKDIPQLVYFGFDDALNVVVEPYYQQLFNGKRKNPNNCPISMSLYVQNRYTDYNLVKKHFQQGHDEIGAHSVTHSRLNTRLKLNSEAGAQKENLHKLGQVPKSQIVGWRSPYLMPAGDAQPEVLKKLGYTYDISLTYTRTKLEDDLVWPFTLDHGYPYNCGVPPCPSHNVSHPGFWVIPINIMFDPQLNWPCVYVDACRPENRTMALDYLKKNFDENYHNKRAPFGLNMHAAWFRQDPGYLQAMHDFLDYILSLGDVYVVSAKTVLDWMRSPSTLKQVKTSRFGCP